MGNPHIGGSVVRAASWALFVGEALEARRDRTCASRRTIVQDLHIESYYGLGALRDVFVNVAGANGEVVLRKTESCWCARAETK